MGDRTDSRSSREYEERSVSGLERGKKEAGPVGFRAVILPKALRVLQKLPKDLRKRISEKIDAALIDPFHYFSSLEGRKEYKLRVGEYRVIADINNKEKLIIIMLIGQRKNIYQNL